MGDAQIPRAPDGAPIRRVVRRTAEGPSIADELACGHVVRDLDGACPAERPCGECALEALRRDRVHGALVRFAERSSKPGYRGAWWRA